MHCAEILHDILWFKKLWKDINKEKNNNFLLENHFTEIFLKLCYEIWEHIFSKKSCTDFSWKRAWAGSLLLFVI